MSTVGAQYKLLLDIDSDESYRYELPVQEVEWNNGITNPFDVVAEVTQLSAVVTNKDGVLARGIFGDFTADVRTEEIANEQLENGSFDTWSLGEPAQWIKNTFAAGMTTSQTASGGGAGTGSLHVTGTGDVGYSQYVATQRHYEVTIVVSQFSGSGQILLELWDTEQFLSSTNARTITASGTVTFRLDVEEMAYFTLRIKRLSGTFTVTIDSISIKEVIVTYGDQQLVQLEVLSNNVVNNGDFTSWSAGVPTNWTADDPTIEEVGSGQAHGGAGTGSVNLWEAAAGSGVRAQISQTLAVLNGYKYRFDLVISYLSAGAKVQVGKGYYATADSVGTHTFYLTANPGGSFGQAVNISTEIRVIGSGANVEATVDSLSIRQSSFLDAYTPATEIGYTIAPPTLVTQRAQVRKGTLVKLVASYQEIQNRQLWVGKLDSIAPTPSIHDEQTIRITCVDPMEQFRDKDYLPPYVENTTADVEIARMLKREPTVTFPYASSFWIVGVPGASELGVNTKPYDGPPMSFETGKTVIPFVGDNSDRGMPSAADDRDMVKQGVSQLGYIRDLMMAEVDGRFFWDGRNSQFVFHNRHHDYTTSAPDALIDDWESGAFIGADRVYNEIAVHFQPREVGAANSVLWTHPRLPLQLAPKQTIKIQVRYQDPNFPSARVGAKDVQQLAIGTDIAANSAADGSGANYIRFISRNVKIGGSGAEITLSNGNPKRPVYITLLQLRGTPIKTYQASSVRVTDGESIYNNDPHPLDYRAQMISDEDTAQSVAEFLLTRYTIAKRRFSQITFPAQRSDRRMRDALTLTIGDRVQVTAPFLEHDSIYVIVGEKHQVHIGRGRHTVTYVLKPTASDNFWLLGDAVHSILGVSTYPVF